MCNTHAVISSGRLDINQALFGLLLTCFITQSIGKVLDLEGQNITGIVKGKNVHPTDCSHSRKGNHLSLTFNQNNKDSLYPMPTH